LCYYCNYYAQSKLFKFGNELSSFKYLTINLQCFIWQEFYRLKNELPSKNMFKIGEMKLWTRMIYYQRNTSLKRKSFCLKRENEKRRWEKSYMISRRHLIIKEKSKSHQETNEGKHGKWITRMVEEEKSSDAQFDKVNNEIFWVLSPLLRYKNW
jgi:hypothetical protein